MLLLLLFSVFTYFLLNFDERFWLSSGNENGNGRQIKITTNDFSYVTLVEWNGICMMKGIWITFLVSLLFMLTALDCFQDFPLSK